MNSFSRLLGHMIACKDATRLVSRLQEGQLSGFEHAKLRWHLAVCAACARFERQIAFLQEAMRRYRG